MLILTRREKEKIMIGNNIEIIIHRIDKNQTAIGIVAPKDITVLREELLTPKVPKEKIEPVIIIKKKRI